MEINKNIIKQQEREVMLEMLRAREATSPNHLNPYWVHDFWSKRLLEYPRN
jgi:hypothetical protein